MPWPAVADVFSGFDKVFSRMTAAECVSICNAYGLLNSTPTVPDYLTAEGALTWMAYNEGAGAYYDPANADWDPSSLPNVTLWLDASDLTTLYSDSAGTTHQSSDGGRADLLHARGLNSVVGRAPSP